MADHQVPQTPAQQLRIVSGAGGQDAHAAPHTAIDRENRWLVPSHRSAAAPLRLFCFPYAGGGAQVFRRWQSMMPSTVEVCAIELPGRGRRLRETAYDRLEPLADAIVAALSRELDEPFALFGHSMGALVAYEVARRLQQRAGRCPVAFFASAYPAPHLAGSEPPLHALPDDQFIAELRRMNGTPTAVLDCRELIELMLPTLRADFAVCETYVSAPGPPLMCPIVGLGGCSDPTVQSPHLAAWREHTRSSFSMHLFPGGHFFLHDRPEMLVDAIIPWLEARHGSVASG